MDSMDNVRERFEALAQHTRIVERRRWWGLTWTAATVAALGLALALPRALQAKAFHCDAGDVPCLIEAINAANANGEQNRIRLAAGTYTLTAIDNGDANGLPVITSTLTITGQGAESTIIERGAGAPRFRILHVAETGSLTLKRLTLRHGEVNGGGGAMLNEGTLTITHTAVVKNAAEHAGGILTTGATVTIAHSIIADNQGTHESGGLHVRGQGFVTLTATTVARNIADGSGGILLDFTSGDHLLVTITDSAIVNNRSVGTGEGAGIGIRSGTVVITNTTIAANTSNTLIPSTGGGIANVNGTLLLLNSTLADNATRALQSPSLSSGGGIFNSNGTVLLQNTLLARNSASGGTGPDCRGPITSLGTNLVGDPTGCTMTLRPNDLIGDPGLDAFTDNGRPGNGHFPLLPTSPAIDAGSDAVCPRTDQLGQRRIGPCDIGAIRFLDKDDRPHDEEDDQPDVALAPDVQVSQ
jgi:hypothetical protein